jgi:hypothetical protein
MGSLSLVRAHLSGLRSTPVAKRIANASGHRRGNPAEALMLATEIVPNEIERECMAVVLKFLAERICQPSEPAH